MKPTTLVFPIDEQNRILLGRKNIMGSVVNLMMVKASESVPFANYSRNLAFKGAPKT